MSAHTPGPWRVAMYLGGAWTVTSSPLSEPRGGEIVEVVYGPNGGTSKANARLIAAAPELARVCELINAHYSASLDYQPPYVALARAALAKARGES